MHKPPKPPRRAVLIESHRTSGSSRGGASEAQFLVRFIAIALILGVLFIVVVAILSWRS